MGFLGRVAASLFCMLHTTTVPYRTVQEGGRYLYYYRTIQLLLPVQYRVQVLTTSSAHYFRTEKCAPCCLEPACHAPGQQRDCMHFCTGLINAIDSFIIICLDRDYHL